MKKVLQYTTSIMVASLLVLTSLALQAIHPPKVLAAYNGANLISNTVFLDSKSMSASQIQSFLVSKGSGLASKSYKLSCYGANSKERQWYTAAGASCDATIPASHIIYYASQIYGVSPKVVLATLQKEQSLITSPNPASWQINQAMGYACPTSGDCSGSSTFSYQIDSGVWALRYHYERANKNYQWWSPSSNNYWVCGSSKDYYKPSLYPKQDVRFYDGNGVHYRTYHLANAATSAMYCYTPHAFNNFPSCKPAYGVSYADWKPTIGNKGNCYSGSYNFVTAFEQWFGSTTRDIVTQVIVGDWNGDGKDGIAVKADSKYFFENDVSDDLFSSTLTWGNASDQVIVGDWNGDGKDEIGLSRDLTIFLRGSATNSYVVF